MKRFILGILLLSLLLIAGLGISRGMEVRHRPVTEDLSRACELALSGASEAARRAALAAKETWEAHWPFTAAFADHEPLEEVDDLFSALEAYSPDSEDFLACCQQLIRRTQAVIRAQCVSWWNLL